MDRTSFSIVLLHEYSNTANPLSDLYERAAKMWDGGREKLKKESDS
jgi:hypothetical protein